MSNDNDATGTAKAGHNGYSPEILEKFLVDIEAQQTEIDDVSAKAKEECAPFRDEVNRLKKAARENLGISGQVLNAVISTRRSAAKVLAASAKLNAEQSEEFDQAQHALGGLANTPLGKAVLDQVGFNPDAKKVA